MSGCVLVIFMTRVLLALVLCTVSDAFAWERVDTTFPLLDTQAVVQDNHLFVFGGEKADGSLTSDLLIFTLGTGQWTRQAGAPSPRSGHRIGVKDTTLLVFGGRSAAGPLNDLHLYNLAVDRWFGPMVSVGATPPPRYNHAALLHGDRMVVFGGTDGTTVFNDVHVYDIFTLSWRRENPTGSPPPPMYGHSVVLWKDHMVVFGGMAAGPSADVYVYDLVRNDWSGALPTYGGSIAPRSHHTAVLVDADTMVVFGGRGARSQAYADTHSLLLRNFHWTGLRPVGLAPAPRYSHAAAAYNGSMMIAGGRDANGAVEDFWTLPLDSAMDTPSHTSTVTPTAVWSLTSTATRSSMTTPTASPSTIRTPTITMARTVSALQVVDDPHFMSWGMLQYQQLVVTLVNAAAFWAVYPIVELWLSQDCTGPYHVVPGTSRKEYTAAASRNTFYPIRQMDNVYICISTGGNRRPLRRLGQQDSDPPAAVNIGRAARFTVVGNQQYQQTVVEIHNGAEEAGIAGQAVVRLALLRSCEGRHVSGTSDQTWNSTTPAVTFHPTQTAALCFVCYSTDGGKRFTQLLEKDSGAEGFRIDTAPFCSIVGAHVGLPMRVEIFGGGQPSRDADTSHVGVHTAFQCSGGDGWVPGLEPVPWTSGSTLVFFPLVSAGRAFVCLSTDDRRGWAALRLASAANGGDRNVTDFAFPVNPTPTYIVTTKAAGGSLMIEVRLQTLQGTCCSPSPTVILSASPTCTQLNSVNAARVESSFVSFVVRTPGPSRFYTCLSVDDGRHYALLRPVGAADQHASWWFRAEAPSGQNPQSAPSPCIFPIVVACTTCVVFAMCLVGTVVAVVSHGQPSSARLLGRLLLHLLQTWQLFALLARSPQSPQCLAKWASVFRWSLLDFGDVLLEGTAVEVHDFLNRFVLMAVVLVTVMAALAIARLLVLHDAERQRGGHPRGRYAVVAGAFLRSAVPLCWVGVVFPLISLVNGAVAALWHLPGNPWSWLAAILLVAYVGLVGYMNKVAWAARTQRCVFNIRPTTPVESPDATEGVTSTSIVLVMDNADPEGGAKSSARTHLVEWWRSLLKWDPIGCWTSRESQHDAFVARYGVIFEGTTDAATQSYELVVLSLLACLFGITTRTHPGPGVLFQVLLFIAIGILGCWMTFVGARQAFTHHGENVLRLCTSPGFIMVLAVMLVNTFHPVGDTSASGVLVLVWVTSLIAQLVVLSAVYATWAKRPPRVKTPSSSTARLETPAKADNAVEDVPASSPPRGAAEQQDISVGPRFGSPSIPTQRVRILQSPGGSEDLMSDGSARTTLELQPRAGKESHDSPRGTPSRSRG